MQQATMGKWSTYVLLLCIGVMAFTSFVYYPRWQQGGSEAAISYDVSGYYWYLPSAFIYHDLKGQSFKDSILAKYKPTPEFMQGFRLPNGNYVMKYSSGMAVMYLPFFTVANAVAKPLGYPADGFSPPYQLAIQIGGFLIAILGIVYFRRLLLLFFSDAVAAITLLILVLGTNYLNYSVIDVGMSHGWLFTIYVFILLNTIYFYRAFAMKYAVRLGLLIGLATLTRPTEALSALIPLLWGIQRLSVPAILAHIRLLFSKYQQAIVAVCCAVLVLSIQLIYWKYVSGHWVVYSYQDQHIYFRSPNFFNYTFSYQSGWLLYTPMMALAFIGIPFYAVKGRHAIAVLTFFLLNYYIVCAWNIWWYGGRAMVQSYPVLMLPVGMLVHTMLSKKWLGVIFAPLLAFCFYMNVWYTHQCHRGSMLPGDSFITKNYYWNIAGRWHRDPDNAILLDDAELFTSIEREPQTIYKNNFESDTSLPYGGSPLSGNRSLTITKDEKLTRELGCKPTAADFSWLKATANVQCENRPVSVWGYSQVLLNVYFRGTLKKRCMYRLQRIVDAGATRNISIYMDVKGVIYDSVGIGFWNAESGGKLIVDDVVVSAWK